MATLSVLAQTTDLHQILDEISTLAGCPVIVTDRQGAILSVPGCHPARCPLHGGAAAAGCPVAHRALSRLHSPQGMSVMDYRSTRHVIAPVRAAGHLQGLVIADGWAPVRGRGGAPAPRLEQMRRGAALAATVLAQFVQAQRSVDPVSGGALSQRKHRVPPTVIGRIPSDVVRQAVSQGWMSPRGLARLREEYRLTWREIEILTLYYLTPSWGRPDDEGTSTRGALAKRLQITEGTLRAYVNGIRGKLGLRARRGALACWLWARAEGILSPDCSL